MKEDDIVNIHLKTKSLFLFLWINLQIIHVRINDTYFTLLHRGWGVRVFCKKLGGRLRNNIGNEILKEFYGIKLFTKGNE